MASPTPIQLGRWQPNWIHPRLQSIAPPEFLSRHRSSRLWSATSPAVFSPQIAGFRRRGSWPRCWASTAERSRPPTNAFRRKASSRPGSEAAPWCADRGVQLVLHGHRHVQRKITQIFPPQNGGGPLQVTAVGCGTSLGAEGIDASFNLVTWNPNNKRWSVTFYLDQSGGRFKEIRAASTKID